MEPAKISSKANSKLTKTPRTWAALNPGDIVDVVAPGFRATDEELAGGIRFLKAWGLKPRVPKPFFGKDVLCSNRDEVRLRHLIDALYAKDSKAIWCMRGGYGAIRLIPELARLRAPVGAPKLFIGLSDITSLHVFLGQKWGWPTVHGPLLDRLGRGAALPKWEKELRRLVFGEISKIEFKGLKPLNKIAQANGRVRARVSGGNLIVLQSTMGTKAQWNTDERILFFEDIGERGYKIDRVLEQFDQAGYFAKTRGVIFGQFTGGNEPDGSNKILPVMKRFAESVKFPVFHGFPCGHDVIQRPLPFETPSELVLGARGTLICETGAQP